MRDNFEVDVLERDPLGFAPTAEWRRLCAGRHNVLLEGPRASTEAVLRVLKPYLREPVSWKRPGAPFELQTARSGALVVEGIAALSAAEQRRLAEWLNDSHHGKQVVSTTTKPLFARVAQGLFDEALYYRLNVILLHVDARVPELLRRTLSGEHWFAPSGDGLH